MTQSIKIAPKHRVGILGNLLPQPQEERHDAVAYGYRVGECLLRGTAVMVGDNIKDILCWRILTFLLGVGEDVVVAADDKARRLGDGLDDIRVQLFFWNLDAVGDLDKGRVEAVAYARQSPHDVFGQGRHDAAFSVAGLPGGTEHAVPHAFAKSPELYRGGDSASALYKVPQYHGERAGIEQIGARCFQSAG